MNKHLLLVFVIAISIMFLHDFVPVDKKIQIELALERGARFVYEKQNSMGAFEMATYFDRRMEHLFAKDATNVYVTAQVLYTLYHLNRVVEVPHDVMNSSVRFLIKAERDDCWTYSTNPNYTQSCDTDDTSLVTFVLNLFQAIEDTKVNEVRRKLVNYMDEEGPFLTWMKKDGENYLDCVVNANALLLFPNETRVCEYLKRNIVTNEWCSIYYHSKLMLYYAISRAYFHGAECLADVRDTVKNEIEYMWRNGRLNSPLDISLSMLTLINFGYESHSLLPKLVDRLLQLQQPGGEWRREPVIFPGYEGSEELTTALCLEALSRYYESLAENKVITTSMKSRLG